MGNELINLIIQSAEMMRANGHNEQLVAVLGLDVDDGGLGGVTTPFGEIKVFARSGLVAPNSMEVMTEETYFQIAAEIAHRGNE